MRNELSSNLYFTCCNIAIHETGTTEKGKSVEKQTQSLEAMDKFYLCDTTGATGAESTATILNECSEFRALLPC